MEKTGVQTVSAQEISLIEASTGERFAELSKSLTQTMMQHFGFDSYADLDIDDCIEQAMDIADALR